MGLEAIAISNQQHVMGLRVQSKVDPLYFKKRFQEGAPRVYETLIGPQNCQQKIVTRYIGTTINNNNCVYSTTRWYYEDGKPKVDSKPTLSIEEALSAHEEAVKIAEDLVARMAINRK